MEPIDANRPANVTKTQITKIDHVDVEIIAKLLGNCARYDDATRRRIGLKTRGDVDALAIDIIFFQNDVRSIQPHSKADALISGHPRSVRSYCFLERKSALRCISGGVESRQKAVACILDDCSVLRCHAR